MLDSCDLFLLLGVLKAIERKENARVKQRFLEDRKFFVGCRAIVELKTHHFERLCSVVLQSIEQDSKNIANLN